VSVHIRVEALLIAARRRVWLYRHIRNKCRPTGLIVLSRDGHYPAHLWRKLSIMNPGLAGTNDHRDKRLGSNCISQTTPELTQRRSTSFSYYRHDNVVTSMHVATEVEIARIIVSSYHGRLIGCRLFCPWFVAYVSSIVNSSLNQFRLP